MGATFGGPARTTPPPEGNAQYLTHLIDDVRHLVGPVFDELEKKDQRGRTSPTPAKKRHPLMVAVESVRESIKFFETTTPTVNVSYVMELVALRITFERWKQHPLWAKMVQSLESEYLHTMITLGAAAFLEDNGNSVVLHETASSRTPDLLLVVGAQQRVAAEVKMPEALRTPGRLLGYGALLQIIKAAVKQAGTGVDGQLPPAQPALLFIGGFQLYASDVTDFHKAATDYLKAATRGSHHRHLMGIGLVPFGASTTQGPAGGQAQAMLGVLVVQNPGYDGPTTLSLTRRPDL